MASGTTDSEGSFNIEWKAIKTDLDSTSDVLAVFEGNLAYKGTESKNIQIKTSITPTSLSLSMSSRSVSLGDRVTFTGYLRDEIGNGVANKRILVIDSDLDFDDTIGSAVTDASGRFSLSWIAEDKEGWFAGNTLEVYAVFEGDSLFGRTQTIQYDLAVD